VQHVGFVKLKMVKLANWGNVPLWDACGLTVIAYCKAGIRVCTHTHQLWENCHEAVRRAIK
jgi:hypothetical protein